MDLSRLMKSLTFRLQAITIFLSLVGVAFGVKSFLHIREKFGEEASAIFFSDLMLQLVVAGVFNLIAAIIIHRIVTSPVRTLGEVMRSLTENKLDIEVPYTKQGTEIGSMARKVAIFKQNALDKKRLEKEQLELETKSKEDKKRTMQELAHRFESRVQGIVNSVVASANHLSKVSDLMAKLVTDVSERANTVTHAANETLGNIQQVVRSVDHMSSSGVEISKQIHSSTNAVAVTVDASEKTDRISQNLGQASERISEIVNIIEAIADQINLLALNATIEAARAGDAGKGFTVVANEVKNLAKQTKDATLNISEHVKNVNAVSGDVITAMGDIKTSIVKVEESSSAVRSAVVVQEKNTVEIAENMQNASTQTAQIVQDIEQVMKASVNARHSSDELLQAVQLLTNEGAALGKEVTAFVHEIENA